MAPSQNNWLRRLAITALLCAGFLTLRPFLQTSPFQPPPAFQPRAIADLNSSSSSNLKRRDFIPCDWNIAGISAAAALNDLGNPDDLERCAKMVYKGHHLLCLMNAPAERVPQSTWVSPDLDIAAYGWDALDNYRSFDFYGLRTAYAALNINDDNTHRREAMMEHASDSQPVPDGPEYEATQGEYVWSFNPLDGAMVALGSYSPDFMASRFGVAFPIVPLKRWSDLTFLTWRALFPSNGVGDVRELTHVFRHNIYNEVTLDGIRSVLEQNVMDSDPFPGKWPGVGFSTGTSQGLALLTLPNTFGVVYLLAQHKVQLGVRVIDRINIFNCPLKLEEGREKSQWCLYLHITAGPIGDGY